MSLTILMHWPDRDLHPNARIIWQVKQLRVKEARTEAYWMAQVEPGDMTDFAGKMEVEYKFYPPDKKPRDLDNLIANMKPALDGIMDALQTNDAQIVRVVGEWGKPIKGGQVRVVVKEYGVEEIPF